MNKPSSENSPPVVRLRFDAGTLVIDGLEQSRAQTLPGAVFDARIGRWRATASAYKDIFAVLYRQMQAGHLELRDEARKYAAVNFTVDLDRQTRAYQQEAVDAWIAAGKRGQIILPTGSGKSWVAQRIIAETERATLVVVPTIDLMQQWYSGLLACFSVAKIGLLGGGHHDLAEITVTTYDSFVIHIPRYGDRFGLLIFDECHHLGGQSALAAIQNSIAPFSLGLTATPERADGRDHLIDGAIGPIVYRRDIRELAGDFLAEYEIQRLVVNLTEEETAAYEAARSLYLDFIRSNGIRMGGPDGWSKFIQLSGRSVDGRRAFKAHREARRLALQCAEKQQVVDSLVSTHATDRVIIFTESNDVVYEISRRILAPTITHQTPPKERVEILKRFNSGEYRAIVTSKVLNEGVDVPEANVAIVLGGSGQVREHVQRLGRILRKASGKKAILYEVVTADTIEEKVSDRRREHDAYR